MEKSWNDRLATAANIVSTLAEAMLYEVPPSGSQIWAGDYPLNAAEGLEVMKLYNAVIAKPVRQALLDAMVSIVDRQAENDFSAVVINFPGKKPSS